MYESLGGYVDQNQIIPNWVGTISLIPKAVPSYLVRFYEPSFLTVDPSTNHYMNVVVNAINGKVVVSFTYD